MAYKEWIETDGEGKLKAKLKEKRKEEERRIAEME